ncbi:MAG: hypothetical protein RSF68_01280 [Myroides sp.]
MKKKIIIFWTIVMSFYSAYPQANNTEAALYNVGFGGISGAIGAVINKKPDEKFGKVLLKGLWQGALGGYVTFESKRLIGLAGQEEDWKLYWTSKFVNAAGNSIKENAANNRDFWEQWNLTVGFNRIEFHTKNDFKVRYKVMPISAVYTVNAFLLFKFDAKSSLNYGQFIFRRNDPNAGNLASATAGYIVYNDGRHSENISVNKIISHEIIHMYQADDFFFVNSFYHKPLKNIFETTKVLNKIDSYIYYDFHLIPLRATYLIEDKFSKKYYDNFLEHEAGFYSNTLR